MKANADFGGRRQGGSALYGRRVGVMVAALILAVSHVFEAGAVGLRLPNQDPEAIARGNAFVATADNASAVYYNPAGITQLEGQQVQVGAYFLSTGVDYESESGAKARTDSSLRPVPQFFYVNDLGELPVSVGLGVYVPYGLALDWGKDNPFRSLVEEGELLYLCFNPVVAVKLHRTLSVGIGPTINYSEASLTRGIVVPGDRFKFEGDGMGYGFNAGVRWEPHGKWALGASYRYLTTVEYEGKTELDLLFPVSASLSSSSKAEIRYPQFAVVGVSYRPTPNWNLEVNLDWTDWDDLDEIVLSGVPLMGEVAVPLHYRSSMMYEFGVTRQLGRGYALSGGYFFSENSSPDRNFTPLVPDTDLHLGSVGMSYRGERWNWALAYHFGYNSGREVRGSGTTATGETADGTYRVLNHAFNVSGAIKF
jgi:long-chain fatty acid transport protein